MMDLTLVGDSITDGWRTRGRAVLDAWLPGARVLGYPGKRPEQITERLVAGDLEQVRGVALVMAGVNSFTLDRTVPEIAANVLELAETCARRADSVFLLSILPAIMWGRNETPRIMEVNERLAGAGGRIRYLNMVPPFLRDGGPHPRMTTDGVHLTPRGYLQLAQMLNPTLGLPPANGGAWRASAAALVGDARSALKAMRA